MLAAVERGLVRINDDHTWGFITCYASTRAQMARTCNWLWEHELIGVYREPGTVQLGDAGSRWLAEWRARHGEPRP
jgi:hypothetical protein